MKSQLMVRRDLDWEGRHLLDGAAAGRGAALREAVQRAVWNPALRVWARPFRVQGEPLPTPAVYVANHASHADTAAVRAAVGAVVRRQLAVAAADDYFFSTTRRAAACTIAVGAFPFPRHGDLGLQRATALLTEGWSVLLYPQGTRNAGSEFRPGALRLGREGWPVVPVGIAGTGSVLPKGARRPRHASAAVVFGQPLQPGRVADEQGRDVFAAAILDAAHRATRLAGE